MPPVTIVGVAANTGVTVCRRGLSRARLVPSWVRLLVAVAAVAVAAVGNADVPLPAQPAFALVVLAVVGCFDVLTVVLLVGHFRDTGDVRPLALSTAYVSPLPLLASWALALPEARAGGAVGSLGQVPSTAPWLWVAWHAVFPLLLAVSLLPWPTAARTEVPVASRRRWAWGVTAAATLAGAGLVALIVAGAPRLPVIIHGTDTGAMTRLVGPVLLSVVALATVATLAGARRRRGPARWAGLAALATLGDVVLSLASGHRYSLGWYAGCTLTMVSGGVLLTALILQFRAVRRQLTADRRALAADRQQLRRLLTETSRLERLQHTVLEHIEEGMVMQDSAGRVLSSNLAARRLLGLSTDELHGRTRMEPRWGTLHADGTPWDTAERPSQRTVRTGKGQRGEVVGVRTGTGELRWLSVNTAPVPHPDGGVEYVVSSMTDITARHTATLAAQQEARAREDRVRDLLRRGGPTMVVQPIVDLATGRIAGAEALARFPDATQRSPEEWFADAAAAGLALELELAAIRAALGMLPHLPAAAYLSINASPDTVISEGLVELLAAAPADRLVLELTEHIEVVDYAALAGPLNRLRWHGVRLAVDDAGSGYASLQHILNLAPDIIKLDAALVRDVDTDPARLSLAASLKLFADRIGATVVAEGIETEREHAALRDLGIGHGQGYYLGHPATRLPAQPAARPVPSPDHTGPSEAPRQHSPAMSS